MIKLIPSHFNYSETLTRVNESFNSGKSLIVKKGTSLHNIQHLYTTTIRLNNSYRVGTQFEKNRNSYRSLNFTGVTIAMDPKFSEQLFDTYCPIAVFTRDGITPCKASHFFDTTLNN
jgi:hypothetical protein